DMRIERSLIIVALLIGAEASAQVTLGNGDHVLEITGGVSMYYNQRFLKEGETNKRKDRFNLRDAQLQFEGRYKNSFNYELQFDMADLAQASAGIIDPENPGLMDANVTYKGIPYLDITMGYGKLLYGRSNLVPFFQTPYWQRAELVRGDLFSRRDVGLTLSTTFCKQRISAYAGAYTGLGETSLRGDNDPSGQLEYIGRIEAAWPSRFRKVDIDDRRVPVPMVAVGVNARYTDKTQPPGAFLPSFSAGEYNIKVIDGKKTTVGGDIAAMYKGFSVQVEGHMIRLEPSAANSALFQRLPRDQHEGYVMAGGYYAQANWWSKKLRTILSVRYEELNLNDLATGLSQRLGGAIAYQVRGNDVMIKAQWWHILEEETTVDPLRWTEQARIGVQYLFR
ncbi:MAG: porin, partial [Flavobacteriales bacterium]